MRSSHAPAGRLNGAVAIVAVGLTAGCAGLPQRNETFRLPASYNFAFYDRHNEAARSFYAAHFAHFGVYELLLTYGEDAATEMERPSHRLMLVSHDWSSGKPEVVWEEPDFDDLLDSLSE